jgi:1-aminocyclopropane-1-carboxylate deaminase/D-cysteine desulfhydrase-like pyridoxal-dependent ACC family enzyme
VLSGPPVDPPGPNQRLEEAFGATVHVTETAERDDREGTVAHVIDDLVNAGRRPYVIAVGGSGLPGCIGQVMAGMELADQSRTFDTIVVPSATGGTQAGLLVGLELAGVRPRVVGAAVAHPADELRATVARLVDELAALTGCRVGHDRIELDDSARGRGYGIPAPDADEAATLLARTEGILVDPIYTAKALALLIRLVRNGALTGQVLFWHAGGTPALFEDLAR